MNENETHISGTSVPQQDVAPVDQPTQPILSDPTVVVSSTATIDDTQPQGSDKFKAVVEKVRAFVRTYSYEVFVVSTIVTITAFTLLFPRLALTVAGVVGTASGWIAYLGLRKR